MKDKDKKLDSIKKNTPKLNYFLKNVQVSPSKVKTQIPDVIKPKNSSSVEPPTASTPEATITNKAEYHHPSFKKALDDISHKVNSLLLRRGVSHKSTQFAMIPSSSKTEIIERFLPVKDKLRTIANNTKKTIIKSTEKTVPETRVVNNDNTTNIMSQNPETQPIKHETSIIGNKNTTVVPEKTVINNKNTTVVPEKTVINKNNTKIVPEKTIITENIKAVPEKTVINNKTENVVVRNAKTPTIPEKSENTRSSSNKIENSISNTLNRIEKINKTTSSSMKLHGIVDNSSDSIKNVFKKSMLMHNLVNKNSISNTNYENVSKVINSKTAESIIPNISTVFSKQTEIPSLALGGFVENPTVAQIGDAKSPSGKSEGEMVISPSKLPDILAKTNVIEETQKRIQKVDVIKESSTKGLSQMANEKLMMNADKKTSQQANTASQDAPSTGPIVINQAGQQTQSAPPTSAQGGQKLRFNDTMNVSLPRWRSKMG
tara:strand:- start:4351 stop:5814 length:1464 start_codon:yes stop_codon:yes gene_type:complete